MGRKLVYAAYVGGIIGPAFLTLQVGGISVFPYRILLLLLWSLLLVQTLMADRRVALHQPDVRWYLMFLLFWIVYAVIGLAWAVDKASTIRGILFLGSAFSIALFSANYLQAKKDMRTMECLWLVGVVLLVAMGIAEHLSGSHLPVSAYYGSAYPSYRFVPTAIFHNPNDFGTYLTISLPFAMVPLAFRGKWPSGVLRWLLAAGTLYLIVATRSRASLAGSTVQIAAFVILFLHGRQRLKAAALVTVLLGAAFLVTPSTLRNVGQEVVLAATSVVEQASSRTESIGTRLALCEKGLSFLGSSAGFGVGLGNSEYYLGEFAAESTGGILNLHNWWLEVLVESGILVFFMYVVFYMALLVQLWRVAHARQKRNETQTACALFLSLVGFGIASTSSSSVMAFGPHWLLIAFVLCFLNHSRKESNRCTSS